MKIKTKKPLLAACALLALVFCAETTLSLSPAAYAQSKTIVSQGAFTPIPAQLYLADPNVKAGNVSGYAGQRERVGNDGQFYAIGRLQFGERKNRGCYLRVDKLQIEDPNPLEQKN